MIERVQFIEWVDKLDLPIEEYIIAGSAWLAIRDIRKNNDIDIIVSTKLLHERWGEKHPGVIPNTPLDIQCHPNHPYTKMFDVKDIDDVVYNHRVMIDGYPFIEERFYKKLKGLTYDEGASLDDSSGL